MRINTDREQTRDAHRLTVHHQTLARLLIGLALAFLSFIWWADVNVACSASDEPPLRSSPKKPSPTK